MRLLSSELENPAADHEKSLSMKKMDVNRVYQGLSDLAQKVI
jgi:hypothetical protein